MNLRKTWLFGGAAVLAAAIALPMALRADGGPGRLGHRAGMHRGGGGPLISMALRHQSDLGLSAGQVENLEKIRAQHRSQAESLHKQLASLENEIAALTAETPANLVQIKLKLQEAEKLRTEMRYARIEALENGKTILNAEQQGKLKALAESARQRFQHRRGQAS